MNLLRVENLSKRFGAFSALKNLSLTIPEKTIVLLIGPNGSGKTTLINCISGVYRPESGKIWFKGVEITGEEPYKIVKLGIGRSFQTPGPFKKLTVGENLLVCSQNHKGENISTSIFKRIWDEHENALIQKLFKILKVVDLEAHCDALADELSGGQLKLLELGRLLMLNSKLMLLDEPVGGINPVLAYKILSQIQKIRDNFGTSFFLVEHRLDLVMQYVDYVYCLAEGNIIFKGSPKEVLETKKLYDIFL